MFIVYKNKEKKPKSNLNKKNIFTQINSSPKKIKEKLTSSNINSSFITNNSIDSGKGLTNFLQSDQNALNTTQKNEFLSKKIKFHIDKIGIEKEESNNIFKGMDSTEGKKKKKRKIIIQSTEEDVNEGRWDTNEHMRFLEAINIFGNEWKEVKKYIGTRSSNQVRSHAQKFFLKCKKFKDDSLDIDFTKANIDTKYIIKTLRDIISNSKDENIIEILYKKLNKLQLKKDVFKKDLSKFDDKLKETYINNDINSNKEKNLDNLQKNDNYTYSKKDSGNIFELRDYCGDFKIINLFDFDEPIKKKEFNEIFNEEINNNFSFFSKDNDFIIDEFINMDNNEKKFW